MGVSKQNIGEKAGVVNNFIHAFNDEFFWLSDGLNKVQFSQNLYDVTGYMPEEINTLADIIDKEDLTEYKKAIRELNDSPSENNLNIEYRIVKKDGSKKWVKECVKTFRDNGGKILRCIGRINDITDEKAAENQRIEYLSNLRYKNQAKDNFLNLLSHDLKSPFTSILGFTEILLKEPLLSEAEKNEYLSYIYTSSGKLLQLINYLLDWSKLQSGNAKINLDRINIRELVYNCISSLTGTAVRKNIEIKVEIDNAVKIQGDERLLNIVITNLISNAIKYSGKESKVNIKVSPFNANFVEFIVKDDGVGIPENLKVKMFRIEKMFSTPGTAGEIGTGFGLTVSKEIVEKHGGNFWFYSEEGNGSEFHLTLPTSPDTILIVESNTGKRNSYISSLEKSHNDFRVISSANAYEAINNLGSVVPFVIVTHHEMPLMNGIQLIETIMNGNNKSHFKIIVFSDDVTGELKSSYSKFGKVVFLTKSVVDEDFLAAVKNLVD